MKRPSLKLRITAWFALMMFVIEALVLAFLLAVNGTVATNDPEARLVRMVEHNANRVQARRGLAGAYLCGRRLRLRRGAAVHRHL